MARVISFFPKQVYMGPNNGTLVNLSDIFEVKDEGQIDVEFRVYGANVYSAVITGTVLTPSDPTFVDAAWKTLSGSFMQTGQGVRVVPTLSGLGRFVRAKLEVPSGQFCCACMNAVVREL